MATRHAASSCEQLRLTVEGAFADSAFPAPAFSLWETRRHPWVELADGIQHFEGDPD
jgi:hypothetical protein